MKAALYARVSSDRQDVDLSISAQVKAIREYAQKNGHIIISEFIDEAESGRTSSRPEFTKMIALARAKSPPFEAILVWKFNRFSRNRFDSITYKKLLKDRGIKVISINEPFDDSPSGQMMEGVIETIDEFYSANLGQDITRGMRENASRGFFNGSRPPYGLRKVPVKDGGKTRYRLEPESEDSVAVKVVRAAFDMSSNDMGLKAIAKDLNSQGYRTSTGHRWSTTYLHKVLTNEAYCGTLVWGKEHSRGSHSQAEPPIRVENAWPAIISPDVFRAVQEKMMARGPRVTHPRTIPSPYLLSGLLRCSCGRSMVGRSAKSHQYLYYECPAKYTQGKESCNAERLPKEKLEDLIIGQVKEKVLSDECLQELVELVNEALNSSYSMLSDSLASIDFELRDTGTRLSKLYDALETGKLSLDDLAPRIRELRERLDQLSKARIQIEADMAVERAEQLDVSFSSGWKASTIFSMA